MNANEAIKNCTVEGNIVKLPKVQLDRKVYSEVKKSLERIGGKWQGGRVSGFVFPHEPSGLLSSIQSGEQINLKKEYQFFPTPDDIAEWMVLNAILGRDKNTVKVLEPSCGQGAIVRILNIEGITPDCYELMPQNIEVLSKSGLDYNLKGEDFFDNDGTMYDVIIANPPFSKNQDIDHITEMYKLLKEGGRIVTISSNSWTFGSSKKQQSFKQWMDEIEAEIYPLDSGRFKSSGTMVSCNILIIDK